MTFPVAPSSATRTIDSARRGADGFAGGMRSSMGRIRSGVGGTTMALQALPDPALRLVAAFSIGLATGLHLAGVPRLVTLMAAAPAAFAGGAMATRRG